MRCRPSGPLDAKLILVGEAPGRDEEREGYPFVGYSGKELDNLLVESGHDRSKIYLTNVFLNRPPNNKFHLEWCRSKKQVLEEYSFYLPMFREKHPEISWPEKYNWPSLQQGKYLLPEFLPEVFRLKKEIEAVKPNLVVALGATAAWALLNSTGISKIRGYITESFLIPGQKVLATWHPAYIQRNWTERTTLVADLMKAKSEMEFPEIRRPDREVWINPTFDDMEMFYEKFVIGAELLAFDIETKHKQIECISFASTNDTAIVIPFIDKSKPGYNYWSSPQDEVRAWKWVKKYLSSPVPKLAQNGLYDIQYLWVIHGIVVNNYSEDTMLLHHALYLELKKDLGYLGSIYTDEAPWKLFRPRSKDEVEKKDD